MQFRSALICICSLVVRYRSFHRMRIAFGVRSLGLRPCSGACSPWAPSAWAFPRPDSTKWRGSTGERAHSLAIAMLVATAVALGIAMAWRHNPLLGGVLPILGLVITQFILRKRAMRCLERCRCFSKRAACCRAGAHAAHGSGVGGMIATNAGGSRLLKDGDVRRNVLGLEWSWQMRMRRSSTD